MAGNNRLEVLHGEELLVLAVVGGGPLRAAVHAELERRAIEDASGGRLLRLCGDVATTWDSERCVAAL